MKFDIPKIIRPLEMSAYAEEMEGLALQVWVNPSRNIKSALWDLQLEILGLKGEADKLLAAKKPDTKKVNAMNDRIDGLNVSTYEWYSDILSQASDPDTHVTAEELTELADEDPAMWTFIAQGTQALIEDHIEGTRKN